MPIQPLKAKRYADEHNTGLVGLIMDELPYCDMPRALAIYRQIIAYRKTRERDLALLACNDRFFLLTQILHRIDMVHPWLYDRTREVEAEPDGYLDLWAREHYKSTIITYAGVLQETLINPEITAAIFSHTQFLGRKFIRPIKQEFETNLQLPRIFPDVAWTSPKKQAPQWSDDGIVLKRISKRKEATVEGWGLVDGMPTGGHYDLLVYDDIITKESVTNPDMVRKATEAWELSDNLGAGDVRKWHIGTRYSFGDSWGQILERKILIPRIYPATDNGTPTGKPVLISQARWDEKKKVQRSTLNAQMLQNPLAGTDQIFRPEWFERRWEVRPATLNVYIMCDPSSGRGRDSDNTSMVVIGMDAGGNMYLLDGYSHRMSLSERWSNYRGLWRRWDGAPGILMCKMGYEEYGLQADIEYFNIEMERGDESFAITKLAWPRQGPHSKLDRIERLEPEHRMGRFFYPAVMRIQGMGNCYWHMSTDADTAHGQQNQIVTIPMKGPTKRMKAAENGRKHLIAKPIVRRDADGEIYDLTRKLIDELLFFPFAPHDDTADATSRIFDMDPISPNRDEQVEADELNDFAFVDD